mgnify:CR=1 FL=1
MLDQVKIYVLIILRREEANILKFLCIIMLWDTFKMPVTIIHRSEAAEILTVFLKISKTAL